MVFQKLTRKVLVEHSILYFLESIRLSIGEAAPFYRFFYRSSGMTV
jgi:hypothetical protein